MGLNLDTATLYTVGGAIVVLTGVVFILHTAFGESTAASRIWACAFGAGILTAVSMVTYDLDHRAWWANAVSNGTLIVAVGGIWAGLREYNGRRSRIGFVALFAAVATAVALAAGPGGGFWAGAWLLFAAISAAGLLTAAEAVRTRRSRSQLDGRVLAVLMGLVGVYYAVRLTVFLTLGPDSAVFRAAFSTAITVFITILYLVVAAICAAVLQSTETRADAMPRAAEIEQTPTPGVVLRDVFEAELQAWLDRANRAWDALVLVHLVVDNLQSIHDAFGRHSGEEVVRIVARIAVDNSPTASVIGFFGGGQFVVLCESPRLREPVTIAEQLHTALVDTPIESLGGLRAIANFGLASTDDFGYEASVLLSEAARAAKSARAAGDGRIVSAEPTGVALVE